MSSNSIDLCLLVKVQYLKSVFLKWQQYFRYLPHVSLLHVWSSHAAAVKTASQVFQISAEVLQQRKSLLSFQTAEPLHRKTLHHLRAAVRAMKSFELKDFIYKHHVHMNIHSQPIYHKNA